MIKASKKTVYVLFMAICMIVAGCTGGSGSNEATSPKPTDTKTEPPPQTAPSNSNNLDPYSEEADQQIIDADLAKVTTPEYFKNSPTFEYVVNFGPTPLKDGSYGQRLFEKTFNVKLKFVRLDGADRKEQLNLMYATGTIPDLVTITLPDVGDYNKQGVLAELPLDLVQKNMPEYYKNMNKFDPDLLSITKVDGKNMGLARLKPNGGVPRPAAIRADWLKNVGITKVPTTIQELEDAFLKFRNDDPDKNGKKDTYALSNPSTFAGDLWFQSIFGAFGANPFMWVEKDGKLQFGLTTPEAKDALKLLNKWYKAGIIDPEFITDNGRSSDVEDLATKFAKGKLGYIESLSFDDHQWDNDGHLSFRWVANSPDWKKFYDDNKGDPAKLYAQKVFTDFDDKVIQPIYIDLPPVKGPQGKSGYHRQGFQDTILGFGKQLEKDPKKLEKLLKILEFLHTDKDTHIKQSFGPEGLMWITDKSGQKLLNPEWPKHKLFHPLYIHLGVNWLTNVMNWTNPDYLSLWGPRDVQRFQLTADVFNKFPSYENKLKVGLPSQAKYSELLSTRVKEYVIKTIAGDIDIDKTFDQTVQKWNKDGGEQLTNEANAWYNSVKK
ncbi:extracellular solute-binding protein [Paenibacillus agricola]|uniref:Extracellular solute-binding protein n=1 Tax=Paenibacillus agricola TaxID=2716264 RepID=A0ABX0JJV3_9BACL|nr:extracellular solute-binding protein [Paenibacillus agricola]NHN34125.1 extracellular solute-binding protein [Paenibacillus agricola]